MLRHDAGSPSFGGTPISASLGIDNVRLVANSPPLTADFDGDGDVDHEDLVQWQDDFGQNGNSDADGDNDSDGGDFLAWQLENGSGVGAAPISKAVPEPASCGLLILAAAGLGGWLGRPMSTNPGGHRIGRFPPCPRVSLKSLNLSITRLRLAWPRF
jgi:hypothetical protein